MKTMKKALFLSIFLSLNWFSFAQKAEEKELEIIIENLFENVFSILDSTKIDTYLTDDFILYEDGEIWNKDSIQNMVRQMTEQFNSEDNKKYTFKRTNQFKFAKSHIEGNSGWIYYENFADFTMDGNSIAKMHWLESAHFIRTGKGWKISFLHSSPVKEEDN